MNDINRLYNTIKTINKLLNKFNTPTRERCDQNIIDSHQLIFDRACRQDFDGKKHPSRSVEHGLTAD